MYLQYHYYTRQYSVEYFCVLHYRIHPSVVDEKLNITTPSGPEKLNGFRPLFQLGLKEMPPGRRWRPVQERTFDISASEVCELHRVLFGEAGEACAGMISLRETLRLLLASVGTPLHIASTDEERDEDSFKTRGLHFEGLEASARWLGRHFRSVAGCAPIEHDGNNSDDGMREDSEDEDEE